MQNLFKHDRRGMFQLARGAHHLAFMRRRETSNSYTSFDVCFIPSRRAERESTGVDGCITSITLRSNVTRASYLRLARMTGYGQDF